MNKSLEQRIGELEKKVAALEGQIQAQPTLEQIVSNVADEIKKSLKSVNL
jgi:hypothetical protein